MFNLIFFLISGDQNPPKQVHFLILIFTFIFSLLAIETFQNHFIFIFFFSLLTIETI